MWAYIGVILLSIFNSGLWAKYIQNAALEKAEAAAVFDLFLMLAGSGTQQIWAIAHMPFAVLLISDVSSALGTYFWIKYSKRKVVIPPGKITSPKVIPPVEPPTTGS
jgi:hypothetical protein